MMSLRGKLAISFGVSVSIVLAALYLLGLESAPTAAPPSQTVVVEDVAPEPEVAEPEPKPVAAKTAEESDAKPVGRDLFAVGGWTLVGRVVENPSLSGERGGSGGLQPMPEAVVYLRPCVLPKERLPNSIREHKRVADANGRFEFKGLPADAVLLMVDVPGFGLRTLRI